MDSTQTQETITSVADKDTLQVITFLIKDFLSPLQVRSHVNEIICNKVAASANILLKIVQNALQASIVTAPTARTDADVDVIAAVAAMDTATAEKYRKIRLSNKVINEKVVKQQGAVDLLTAVGFVYFESAGEKYLTFVPDKEGTNVGLANFFCITLQEELATFQKKEKETKKNKKEPSRDDNKGNTFLSEEERKARRIKANKLKKDKKAAKEIAMLRWNEDNERRRDIEKRKQNIKSALTEVELSKEFAALTQTKIRKLESQNHEHGTTPNESLLALRAKAQETWKQRHGVDNTVKSVEDMDIDTEDATKDKELEVEKDPFIKHDALSPLPVQHRAEKDEDSDKTLLKPVTVKSCTSQTVLVDSEEDKSPSWEECLEHIPRCGPSQNIRETSVFYKDTGTAYAASSSSPKCFRRLFAEFDELEKSLPSDKQCTAWLRFDEETPQYLRALLPGPLPGPSPYAGGVFAFDIYIPDNYPMECPKVNIVTTGRGTVRFGPNLYAEGKVCLSLLGTWSGPKWDPKKSSIHQVLVSIQSLLLGVEHPYFLEPGFGGWEDQVKEGDFASTGHTLNGATIREEITLPPEAWHYEDKIRVGSIQYAMIEPLCIAANTGDTKINPSIAHLMPFENIIKSHFYHNGDAILASTMGWLNTSRPTDLKNSDLLDTMHELFQNLESAMGKVSKPLIDDISTTTATVDNSFGNISTAVGKPKSVDVETESNIERLSEKMKKAAQSGNFILAGEVQKKIQEIKDHENKIGDLKAKIEDAASKGDYISAGNFQAQLQTIEEEIAMKNNQYNNPTGNHNQMSSINHEEFNEIEADGFNSQEEEEFLEDEEYHDEFGSNAYSSNNWGSGKQLGLKSDTAPFTQTKSVSQQSELLQDASPRMPVIVPCRLRIRLPGSESDSLLEIFDGSEKLTVLYKCIKGRISKLTESSMSASPRLTQLRGITNQEGNQAIGVHGGAFANPYSEYGFTLLTTHPKREFSLEMHGSTSLKDLGLVPSATLTVMMCSARGQVKRGILESKLGEAQGDAMEIEGLSYEALQELGEKIGIAAPGDGAWKGIDESTLEKISISITSKDYCMQKSVQEDDLKCPICLGEYDSELDTQLRTLTHCKHTFHSACLRTWLSTKTNCPVCKYSLSNP